MGWSQARLLLIWSGASQCTRNHVCCVLCVDLCQVPSHLFLSFRSLLPLSNSVKIPEFSFFLCPLMCCSNKILISSATAGHSITQRCNRSVPFFTCRISGSPCRSEGHNFYVCAIPGKWQVNSQVACLNIRIILTTMI
jgi:hypothetical protein